MKALRHTLTDKDPTTMTATCAVCGPGTDLIYIKSRNQYACRRKKNEIKRDSARKHYSPAKNRWENIERRYGLTEVTFTALLESQGGGCAVCGTTELTGKGWHVDHDRACCETHFQTCGGCVRGILCSNCNTALGLLKDNPDTVRSALAYLQKNLTKLELAATEATE